ncbi:MAG: hypothetical protein ACLVHS_07855 [Blautia wexlerae]
MKVMLVNGSSHLHGTTIDSFGRDDKGILFRRSRNRRLFSLEESR